MRVIFFNIWHGMVWDKLKPFIESEKSKTDIFCFLEVNPVIQTKLQLILSRFSYVYFRGIKNTGGLFEGRSFFVSNKINILKNEVANLYTKSAKETGGMSLFELVINEKKLTIGCIHGKPLPGSKLDTPERIKQSNLIVERFKNIDGPKIIGGDFNLDINTESLKIIERAGYKNLIKEFGIKNTRNKLSWDQFPEEVEKNGKQYFADYCFVTPDVNVMDFDVPQLEASDHEPQILDFEI